MRVTKKNIPLYLKIMLGIVLGLVFGVVYIILEWPPGFIVHYIKPFGTLFVNALKVIAVPLVLASLIVGVSNLGDVSKLSRMGGKTIAIYLATTVLATSIGLLAVNVLKPGEKLPADTRDDLLSLYSNTAQSKTDVAMEMKNAGPLDPIVKLIPTNIVAAAADNKMMLQVVIFAIFLGVALLDIAKKKGATVVHFFDGLNEAIIQVVHYIMKTAPYCVFALIASLIVEIGGSDSGKALDLLLALLWYVITVLLGLGLMMLVVYPMAFTLFTKTKYSAFFKGIRPAQLLAFSTSSSSATLPLTMECVEQKLNVKQEVSSFVLPLGATINMDGTSLYQSVAAVFIAQALGLDLSIGSQLMIVLTATLASIGSAGVPGAGMVMLVIVLEAIGVPAAGIALIVAPDRILDMCRTAVNVTGDATVAMLVGRNE